ncbi:MAG: NYN domain-containing protein [Candidatus Woesearchaeota archaeon]
MAKNLPKAQRVGVFVDVQNMYYSARYMYNAKVNFKALLNEAVQGRTLVRAIAYVIRTEDVGRDEFFKVLENIGYEVKGKDIQVFVDGSKKGDWDIGIAMDMIELAPRLDTLVLVSGDGDFIPLVEHLQRAMGCRVEVIAFGKSASGKLKEAANNFIDLDENPKKFLISRAAKPRLVAPAGPLETHREGVGQNARSQRK